VILLSSLGHGAALDPLYVFLPFALAGFVTIALFSARWLAQLFADQDEGSK
jgi:lipid-A-disaccharide synthase-like uncharacterized protein